MKYKYFKTNWKYGFFCPNNERDSETNMKVKMKKGFKLPYTQGVDVSYKLYGLWSDLWGVLVAIDDLVPYANLRANVIYVT